MTCQTARELFSARVDDALAPDERAALEAHLSGCADCRRELSRFEATVVLLRAVEPARAPAGFVDRVLAAARPGPWYARLRRRLVAPLGLRRPIEVTVVLLVGLTAVYLFRASEVSQLHEYGGPVRRARPSDTAELEGRPPAPPAPPSAPPATPGVSPAAPRVTPRAKKEPSAVSRDAARQTAQAPEPAPPPTGSTAPSAAPPRAAPAPPATPGPVRSESAARPAEPAPARERRAAEVDELKQKSAATRAPALAARRPAPADVSGTLTVADRDAAGREIAELLARLGATQAGRRTDAAGAEVELIVPAARYAELADGLSRLGRWQPDRPPGDLPAEVRVVVRLVAD